jgi:methionine--tRNA ligase beta chain
VTLAWFVEDACTLAEVSPLSWSTLPREEQIRIIRAWETHVGTKDDYVKKANFLAVKETEMEPRSNKPKDLPYDDFAKLDIRVGTIINAERLPKSKKLIKLRISFGDLGERTILAGIHPFYDVPQLINAQVVAVLNLAPRQMMGIESHGMILAAHNQDGSEIHLVTCPGSTEGREVG